MAKRILAISFAFPPMQHPQAVQVERLLRHCSVHSTVICCAPGHPELGIDSVSESGDNSTVAIPHTGLGPWVDRILFRLVPLFGPVPDDCVRWAKKVVTHILNLPPSFIEQIDCLVTFGQPMADHLVGLALKRRFPRLPWIAHFSDPWTDNPYTPASLRRSPRNRASEQEVLMLADRLIFTTRETADLVTSKHPPSIQSKVNVLPHSFESSRFPARTPPSHSKEFVFRHLGELYGRRNPFSLIQAIEKLRVKDPAILDNVRFEFVGRCSYSIRLRLLACWNLAPLNCRFLPAVPYSDSLQLMVDSDCLILLEAPAKVGVFLPSKLIDYLGSGRPILGITPRGAAQSILSSLGEAVADPSSVEEIQSQIETAIRRLKSGDFSTDRRRVSRIIEFEAKSVAQTFTSIIRELTDEFVYL